MGWRVINEDDVIASMSVAELEAYKTSANWDSDPMQILMRRTAAWVRDQIRTNGNIRLSPNEYEIPEGTISYAVDYLIFDIVKRLGGETSEERRKGRDEALKYFEKISRRWVTVESYGAAPEKSTAGAAVQIVQSAHHRMTCESLENI